MARSVTHRRGYVRPSYTHADRERTSPRSGAAPAAVLVPALLIAGGFLLWKKSQQTLIVGPPISGALPGMGDLGFSLKKAVKKVTNSVQKVTDNKVLRPVLAVATVGMSEATRAAANFASDPSGQLKRIDPIKLASQDKLLRNSPLVKKLRPRGQAQSTQQPLPGQSVVYQDINGTIISQGEYNAIMQAMSTGSPVQFGSMWAMPAGYMITAAAYAAQFPGTSAPISTDYGSSSGTSYTDIVSPSGSAPSGGGGGGGSDYSLPPEAPAATQQYAAAPADLPAAAAEKKFNPLIAIGALIAVPVVMGLTGGK